MFPQTSTGEQYVRSYPGHASFAANARRDLHAFLAGRGVGEEDAGDLVAAVGEILGLVVEERPKRRGGFRIEIRLSAGYAQVEVFDDVARFGKSQPVHSSGSDALAPRGLGLKIIKQLVDRVTFVGGGRSVRLVKRLAQTP